MCAVSVIQRLGHWVEQGIPNTATKSVRRALSAENIASKAQSLLRAIPKFTGNPGKTSPGWPLRKSLSNTSSPHNSALLGGTPLDSSQGISGPDNRHGGRLGALFEEEYFGKELFGKEFFIQVSCNELSAQTKNSRDISDHTLSNASPAIAPSNIPNFIFEELEEIKNIEYVYVQNSPQHEPRTESQLSEEIYCQPLASQNNSYDDVYNLIDSHVQNSFYDDLEKYIYETSNNQYTQPTQSKYESARGENNTPNLIRVPNSKKIYIETNLPHRVYGTDKTYPCYERKYMVSPKPGETLHQQVLYYQAKCYGIPHVLPSQEGNQAMLEMLYVDGLDEKNKKYI